MMELNPFPDYAVMRLNALEEASSVTIVTTPIRKGRELVRSYASRVSTALTGGQTYAALCAVRGDYGTGKTHLLNDVAQELQKISSPEFLPSVLRSTCIEAAPLTWFRTKVGPQLESLPIQEVVLRIYSKAGEITAEATRLTAPAADLLRKNPSQIRDLVRKNQLSIDEVRREFENQIGSICKNYDAVIRRVLSKLVWGETEATALKWLTGASLLTREAELLGVPPQIDSADQAAGVIGAVAALHRATGRGFLFLVDELEHFTRYDNANGSNANITWLKRLLEELGSASALALIAGHWSAWETTKDYLDRFPQHSPIDLLRLEPEQIRDIIHQRIGKIPPDFGDRECKIIADLTVGNMRRVMSLCNALFRRSNGFKSPVTPEIIHEVWNTVTQRLPEQQALELISELLTRLGYRVEHGSHIESIRFDLTARSNDGRIMVVQMQRAKTQSDHVDAAHKFVHKLQHLSQTLKNPVGIFLADGSVDDELVRILKGANLANMLWFDLTQRDAPARIRNEIESIDTHLKEMTGNTKSEHAQLSPQLSQSSPPAGQMENSRDQKIVDLENKFRELDRRRQQETDELKARLEKFSASSQSPRTRAIHQETELNPERERMAFEALIRPLPLHSQLRYLGSAVYSGISLVVFAFFIYLMKDGILDWHLDRIGGEKDSSFVLVYAALLAAPLLSVFLGVSTVWRSYVRLTEYFEFSRTVLSDLYLRDVPVVKLSGISKILGNFAHYYRLSGVQKEVIHEICRSVGPDTPILRYFDDLAENRHPEWREPS